jgi:hypothetical protein
MVIDWYFFRSKHNQEEALWSQVYERGYRAFSPRLTMELAHWTTCRDYRFTASGPQICKRHFEDFTSETGFA